VLVFIHGYNVSFEDAARRAAQLAYDLEFAGIPMLYSWPSVESVAKYTIDETNVRWSQEHFREFITICRTELAVRTVHLVAHSMGSRLLAETLPNLEYVAGAAMLRQVVFAAPDIDADTFRQLAAAFQGQAERCTLYASSKDYALQASKAFHGYARAGDSGANLVFAADVDTIDATEVDTSLLGHSFYGDNRSILSDLFTLVRDGYGPAQRFGLREVDRGGITYWAFQP
jgi:esterase/lipase superfamily enzyme